MIHEDLNYETESKPVYFSEDDYDDAYYNEDDTEEEYYYGYWERDTR